MIERREYSAGAVKMSFWFMEFRKVVGLLASGKSFDEVRKLNREENLFSAPTVLRANQIYSTVSGRIKMLDESFYQIFLASDLATQKLFALVAAMAYDTLFFDFVYEVIREKKITDSMVLADMKLAADTPADVILFNIDSKSESTSKQNKDAIVNVFLKVFNEMQGFCGSIPQVADLERRLTEEGRFEEFQAAFKGEYGEAWKDSRQDFDFIQDSVVDVLV